LLVWKGVALISKMKVGKKRDVWNRIVRDGNGGDKEESNPARWTDEDEDELERLRTAPVTIGDTAYARFEDQMIQDAELAYEKMTPEQRAAYLSKLMEIDAAGVAYDDGNAPTNKAPV